MDFKLFTGTLKAYETESGDRYVSGTTSSTIRDLHGDEMSMNALKSMCDTAKQNMTVFLNHNYNVPEDLFGSATDARIVKRRDVETGEEVYDLDIDVKVCPEDENPQAMQAYRAIKRGVKLGLSIGARVETADKKRDDKSGLDTYVIDKVRLLEASVVGIPANQRSYLHNAVKSLRGNSADGELEHTVIRDLTDAVKAVEVEGQQAADKAPLVGALYTLISQTTAFYLKAHGAHWNVTGEHFSAYHELFEEIYTDVHASLDPIAENLRKLNSPAPAELKDLAEMANETSRSEGYDAEALAADLYAANEKLIENIMVAFKAATDLNEQGTANFLAERQDKHKKWSWQLRASLAPEAEDQNEAEMEKSMNEEIAPQAEEVAPVAPEAAEPAEAVVPAAEEPQIEAAADTEEYREISDADVEEVRASATSNRRALETGQPLQGEADAPVAEPVAAEPVAGEVAVEAAPAAAAPIDAVIEEPAVSAAPQSLGDEPVVEGEEVSEKSADVDLLEIVALAKSALDAAVTSQQEVDALKIQVTELSEAKAKVEGDLENAHNIINRLSVEGVGRKTVSKQMDEVKGSDARWLHPYIQGVLDAQE
jgi:starvation-inducible DNA-binding protein